MKQKMNDIKKYIYIAILVQIALLAIFYTGLKAGILTASIILICEIIMVYIAFDAFEHTMKDQFTGVKDILGEAAQQAYLFGQTGIVLYDDHHVITWMSDLFVQRGINRVGNKIFLWLPEAEELIKGNSDRICVTLDEHVYEVTRKDDEQTLFFKDITELSHFKNSYLETLPVIGLASFDNYDESTQYEDETVVSSINVAIRTPLSEYCKQHGILIKRVNSSRYLLVLNEKIFAQLGNDRFSILNTIRKAAQKQEVSITLSMAFARGTDNYEELDEMVNRLMDLAQTRGGDQVAIQKVGEDVVYFGGSSEALEKRSRVRVRVIAHTLKELINRSSNVIICCHKEADFDCMGSALGMAKIVSSLHKPVVIIGKTGGLEEKLSHVLAQYKDELNEEFTLVTESEALNQLHDQTLVILVDHHNVKQSNGGKVLESAKSIAVIDHHRRSSEMGMKPILVYVEAGASSTSELITEFIPYISNKIEISPLLATIMLTGITIDTGHFRVRTGSRTYDAASNLRKWGADPLLTDEFLKDTYEEVTLKSNILRKTIRYEHGILITPVDDMIVSRSLISQIADSLLQIQDVEASFVIAKTSDDQTAISARSKGKVNVQVIMENMNGGGHMTAAAVQRNRCEIKDLQNELLEQIDFYFKEVVEDESHSQD